MQESPKGDPFSSASIDRSAQQATRELRLTEQGAYKTKQQEKDIRTFFFWRIQGRSNNMAFLSKVGRILRQTSSTHITASNSMMLQSIRCMSSSKSSAPSNTLNLFPSKVFVGGISYSTDEFGLREAFSEFGQVVDAKIVVDRETGKSRGFGFVTFTCYQEATNAINIMDTQYLHGRRIRVNYATERGSGFGGGGGFPVFYDDPTPCGYLDDYSIWIG